MVRTLLERRGKHFRRRYSRPSAANRRIHAVPSLCEGAPGTFQKQGAGRGQLGSNAIEDVSASRSIPERGISLSAEDRSSVPRRISLRWGWPGQDLCRSSADRTTNHEGTQTRCAVRTEVWACCCLGTKPEKISTGSIR